MDGVNIRLINTSVFPGLVYPSYSTAGYPYNNSTVNFVPGKISLPQPALGRQWDVERFVITPQVIYVGQDPTPNPGQIDLAFYLNDVQITDIQTIKWPIPAIGIVGTYSIPTNNYFFAPYGDLEVKSADQLSVRTSNISANHAYTGNVFITFTVSLQGEDNPVSSSTDDIRLFQGTALVPPSLNGNGIILFATPLSGLGFPNGIPFTFYLDQPRLGRVWEVERINVDIAEDAFNLGAGGPVSYSTVFTLYLNGVQIADPFSITSSIPASGEAKKTLNNTVLPFNTLEMNPSDQLSMGMILTNSDSGGGNVSMTITGKTTIIGRNIKE